MRKIIVVFSFAWVTFSVIMTGYEVLQPKWRERLRLNPYVVQELAGNIYNQGAVALANDPARPKEATFFVDQEPGLLQGLPLTYWLSPTYLSPVYERRPSSNIVTLDSTGTLEQTVQSPEGRLIYYVGTQQTLDDNVDLLQPYTQTLVRSGDGLVFVKLERK